MHKAIQHIGTSTRHRNIAGNRKPNIGACPASKTIH